MLIFLLSILHTLLQCNFTLFLMYICARTGKDGFSMYFHFVSGVNFLPEWGGGQKSLHANIVALYGQQFNKYDITSRLILNKCTIMYRRG
jgi:hypothetical protein